MRGRAGLSLERWWPVIAITWEVHLPILVPSAPMLDFVLYLLYRAI